MLAQPAFRDKRTNSTANQVEADDFAPEFALNL
jgi:hypothetical protein